MAKIGEGHVAAMGRLGWKELRNAANPSRESVADSEVGLYGSKTQGEIAESRGGAGGGPEQEAGTMTMKDLETKQPENHQQRERDRGQDRGMDRGR